jgi:Holliday junction DNA helicase RuvB
LNYYEPADIEKIIGRSAEILGVKMDGASAQLISHRSRLTPRIANRILKRVRDYVQVKGNGEITGELTNQALAMLEIDAAGLDSVDRRILEVIVEKFKGGPVGLNSIAAVTSEEMGTIEEIYEPYLMQLGLIQRTSRGRVVTELGYRHLGLPVPADWQQKII